MVRQMYPNGLGLSVIERDDCFEIALLCGGRLVDFPTHCPLWSLTSGAQCGLDIEQVLRFAEWVKAQPAMPGRWLVWSPSRISYMGWTPTSFFRGLQPCRNKQEFASAEEARALAAAVGDGKVEPKWPPVKVEVETSAEYW